MASEEDHIPVFNDEDLDDDDELHHNDVLVDDEDDDVDVDDDDVDDSTSSSNLAITDPLHALRPPPPMIPSSVASEQVTLAVAALPAADLKRQRMGDVSAAAIVAEKKPLAVLDESRKLFQRLWTDEDEIELLQGFLEYTTRRGINGVSSHHHDTSAFYDQIKDKLQLEFNKNQLVEKLRRLKKKYRNVMSKIGSGKDFVFKSAHDQATFEISRKIWNTAGVSAPRAAPSVAAVAAVAVSMPDDGGGFEDEYPIPNSNLNLTNHSSNPNGVDIKTPKPRKRSRGAVKIEQNSGYTQHYVHQSGNTNVMRPAVPAAPVTTTPTATPTATSIPNLIEETVKSCLSPIFKELLQSATNVNSSKGFDFGVALSPMPLGFGGGSMTGEMLADEKWRKQQILELEVYSKRLELVQDQIKARLEELRSMGSC